MKEYLVRYQVDNSSTIKEIPRIYAKNIEGATIKARKIIRKERGYAEVSIIGVYDRRQLNG